jgi:hypothetical protein
MNAIKAQTQLADATAEMMRACALLTARTASLSASRSFQMWAHMLAASTRSPWSAQWRAAWAQLHGQTAGTGACLPQTEPAEAAPEPPTAPDPPDPAFASYRSAGGHAAAQVIVG